MPWKSASRDPGFFLDPANLVIASAKFSSQRMASGSETRGVVHVDGNMRQLLDQEFTRQGGMPRRASRDDGDALQVAKFIDLR